jgi:hypothetical protein
VSGKAITVKFSGSKAEVTVIKKNASERRLNNSRPIINEWNIFLTNILRNFLPSFK